MTTTIAVYAICKNEESHVLDFLDTCHDADAVYIADTGSTDGTFRQFMRWQSLHPWTQNKVHVQSINVLPWRFDTGRNVALSLVPPSVNICVVLDLDETISPGWRKAVLERWHGNVNNVRPTYVTEDGEYRALDGRRIHSRSGWGWRHACHEQLYPYGGRGVFADAPEISITHNRIMLHSIYLDLCYTAWQEDPTDCHTQFFLGREFYIAGEYEQAVNMLGHYLEVQVNAESEQRRLASVFYNRSLGMVQLKDSGISTAGMKLQLETGLVVPA